MEYIKSLGVLLPRGRALDFGCGVGRLTEPLADYFNEVCGVDIASSMIELASTYNAHKDRCKYYLNETDDLGLFREDSFDFIYTNITLQHMEPRYFKNYIREFLRVLSPSGLLMFQLPSEPARTIKGIAIRFVPQTLLNVYRRVRYSGRPIIEMYGMKREDVVEFLQHNGARVVEMKEDQSSGQDWISFRYCVVKEKRMA
jgi:ubiquinone/menaquinone biosynthesis C-methylase UbiE